MQAKSTKKLRLSTETVRQLTDLEVLEKAVVGGASRLCTGTATCTDTCTGRGTCLC